MPFFFLLEKKLDCFTSQTSKFVLVKMFSKQNLETEDLYFDSFIFNSVKDPQRIGSSSGSVPKMQ